jgi:UDP-glucose 4-epimerase
MFPCPNLELARRFVGKSVLVTGGAGFIGSHLCRALVDGGADVRVIDDLSSGRRDALPAGVRLSEGDVADECAVREAVEGCSHVFHLAALVSVPLSIEQPDLCFRSNMTGTEVVLRNAVRAGVGSVVHASSASVYGPRPRLPSSEDDPVSCASPYAATKAAGESLVQAFARAYGLHATSLRLFNVFGPGQDPKGAYSAAISAFVDAARARRPAVVFGDGMQTRDFVPVSEVVQSFLRAADAGPAASGEVFNVGLGERVTLLEVIEMIGAAAGFRATPQFAPRRAGDVDHSWADLTKIRRVLGYRPTTALAPAIAAFVRGAC